MKPRTITNLNMMALRLGCTSKDLVQFILEGEGYNFDEMWFSYMRHLQPLPEGTINYWLIKLREALNALETAQAVARGNRRRARTLSPRRG